MYCNLETKRLRIRPITLKDAQFILELVNSEGWLKFIGDRNINNKADAQNYIQNILNSKNSFYHVFELKDMQKPIGVVTLLHRENEEYPDLGFALLPAFEKYGYTVEACVQYLSQIKETNQYDTIIAFTIPDNHASIRLLSKLGFSYEGDFDRGDKVLSYYRFVLITDVST